MESNSSSRNVSTHIPFLDDDENAKNSCTQNQAQIYAKDTIVNSVLHKFIERSNLGIQKYGTTLDRNDLSLTEWYTHMQEELMDAILYLEKIKMETEKKIL